MMETQVLLCLLLLPLFYWSVTYLPALFDSRVFFLKAYASAIAAGSCVLRFTVTVGMCVPLTSSGRCLYYYYYYYFY